MDLFSLCLFWIRKWLTCLISPSLSKEGVNVYYYIGKKRNCTFIYLKSSPESKEIATLSSIYIVCKSNYKLNFFKKNNSANLDY